MHINIETYSSLILKGTKTLWSLINMAGLFADMSLNQPIYNDLQTYKVQWTGVKVKPAKSSLLLFLNAKVIYNSVASSKAKISNS